LLLGALLLGTSVRSRPFARARLLAGLACAAVLASSHAAAQPAPPPDAALGEAPERAYKRHLDLGVKLFNDANYDAAIAEFEAAYRAEPKASPLINVALSQKALFRYTEAIATLERALAEHAASMTDKDQSAARGAIDEMRALLAHVTLRVSPSHATVTVDGRAMDADALTRPIAVGPGTHEVRATADGYAPEVRSFTVASGENDRVVEVALTASQGYLEVATPSVDAVIAGARGGPGRGGGGGGGRALLDPGTHVVTMTTPGAPPHGVEVDIVPGKTVSIEPGRGGRPIAAPEMPTVPPPPPPPTTVEATSDTGVFFFVTVSTMFPVTHPLRDPEVDFGGTGGLRLGYRVNSVAAFDFMVEYEDVGIEAQDRNGKAKYSLFSWRLGPTLRVMTPTEDLRGYFTVGGGLAHDDVEFVGFDASNQVGCEHSGLCADASGFGPFMVAEAGFELDLSGVLVGAALESVVHSSKGVDRGGSEPSPWNDDAIVQLGPSLRVGYAFW
jgi:hypothetical protein